MQTYAQEADNQFHGSATAVSGETLRCGFEGGKSAQTCTDTHIYFLDLLLLKFSSCFVVKKILQVVNGAGF